ncbi:MAG: hypothetical protein V4582_09430 [Pseudomonadota bacterium]
MQTMQIMSDKEVNLVSGGADIDYPTCGTVYPYWWKYVNPITVVTTPVVIATPVYR